VTLVFARLSESSFGEFFVGFGSSGGAIINFFYFYLFVFGDIFSFYSIKINGGRSNFFTPLFTLSDFTTFLSVLKHFYNLYPPYLFLECLLNIGV